MMRFADPLWLWGLLVPPLLFIYQSRWGHRRQARGVFSSFDFLVEAGRPNPRRRLDFLRGLALGLAFLALARPQIGHSREVVITPTTDVMLVLDISSSMRALDFDPKNRLEAAQDVIRDFISQRPHDRLGLVVFSAYAFTQCPLTLDHGALLEFLDQVHIGAIEDGTAIGLGIATAASRLKNSAAKSKVMVLLTDGRNNRGNIDPVTAARAAAALGVKIYTVGSGALGGSKIPVDDPLWGRRLVPIQEDLDEGTLRAVANASGGKYFRARDTRSLKDTYREIDRLEKTDLKTETLGQANDLYLPWAWAAALLFALECLLGVTVWAVWP